LPSGKEVTCKATGKTSVYAEAVSSPMAFDTEHATFALNRLHLDSYCLLGHSLSMLFESLDPEMAMRCKRGLVQFALRDDDRRGSVVRGPYDTRDKPCLVFETVSFS
jgi:hypothetical protein